MRGGIRNLRTLRRCPVGTGAIPAPPPGLPCHEKIKSLASRVEVMFCRVMVMSLSTVMTVSVFPVVTVSLLSVKPVKLKLVRSIWSPDTLKSVIL